MTGSGKTGLGIALLEEAAIDGVPALVLDPKGDLSNLLLTFPELRTEDFLPWTREEDAERKGKTRQEFAASQAETWRRGLAEWGEDGERIRRLRDAAEVSLYTPGSELATPISILASFAAPARELVDDTDLFRDRVETTATSLLSLAGIAADPLRSREHILISTLLSEAWKAGKSYELASLISDIQKPPISKVGVMDLETFYPAGDRFGLAMQINNLLAAPGFDVWLKGEALSLDRLLRGRNGKPRLAVISIAHLSDAERMFFVSLLLNETLSWVRSQSGSSSLRALLYMDEVAGYFPPVAAPPSKKPMLTLLKQARAFGFGVVLATQNPVDLDYKALSNIGTWFLGRLQTERDKARVLDGLEGASASAGAGFDRQTMDKLLSGLRARVFLLHNVHEKAPTLFETRWVMSYLAGPLDRDQIRALAGAASRRDASTEAGVAAKAAMVAADVATKDPAPPGAPIAGSRPVLNPAIREVFVGATLAGEIVSYRPQLLGLGVVTFSDNKSGAEASVERFLLADFGDLGGVAWERAPESELSEANLAPSPSAGVRFLELPAAASDPRRYARWEKELSDFLYRNQRLRLHTCTALGETSRPQETEKDFRIRMSQLLREQRDTQKQKLQEKFEALLQRADQKIARAQERVEREKSEASTRTVETAVSVGASVLGALFGRKLLSTTNISRAGSAARSVTRAAKEREDMARARAALDKEEQGRADLEAELESQVAELGRSLDPQSLELETVEVKPRRTDVRVKLVALAWTPLDAAGRPLAS